MLYFDHGYRESWDLEGYFFRDVEWDAITYLQLANKLIHSINPNAITIAEEVSGMPGICQPVHEGGFGFDYRLGMAIPDYWFRLLKEKQDEEWDIHEMWHVMNNRLPGIKTVAYCESHDQALVGDQTLAFRLMQSNMYFHMLKKDSDLLIDRGMALHKMIRLFTLALGGQAWLNFMGNEFGHPDWIDFPREGNNWSFKYARRMWSLVEDPDLKFHFLGAFDKAMLNLAGEFDLLNAGYGQLILMDEKNKTIVFEKNHLIFVFNFHVTNSIPGYAFMVPEPGYYKIILNADDPGFGGHGRIDNNSVIISQFNETDKINRLLVYNTNRTAIVLKKI
jgi:1,4-alpha-glucan branching enzyme